MKRPWFPTLLAAVAVGLLTATPALADKSGVSGKPTERPQPINAQSFNPTTTTIGGGASVLPTTRTLTHWWGSATNPDDGITYGFNMVGADPNNCSGDGCSVTIQADITPLIVNFDGMTYDGTAVVGPTLDSPQFAPNDYGSTPAATAAGDFPEYPQLIEGPGGPLSQGDSGVPLQLQDATMRAQFNQVGTGSPYHLILHPNVLPPVTINVPHNQGILRMSPQGVVFPTINISWWASQINNLESTADPTHLPIYLSNGVLLQTVKFLMVALVFFIGRDLCIALADEFSVHEQTPDIDVGQQTAIFVTALCIELKANRLPCDKTTVGLKGLLAAILGELIRVVGFRGVETRVAYLLPSTDNDGIPIEYRHHWCLSSNG